MEKIKILPLLLLLTMANFFGRIIEEIRAIYISPWELMVYARSSKRTCLKHDEKLHLSFIERNCCQRLRLRTFETGMKLNITRNNVNYVSIMTPG